MRRGNTLMLSFYEFDCLLRKNQKRQRKLDEMAFGAGFGDSLNSLADLLAQHGKKPVAAPAPAAAPQTVQAAAPLPEPTAAPAAAQAPAAAPRKQGAPRKDVAGAAPEKTTQQAVVKPAVVRTGHAPDDPDSPQMLAHKEKHGREKGGVNREVFGSAPTELSKWNIMLKSGAPIGGQPTSTWAWALKTKLEEFGVKFPTMQPGQMFQLIFPGMPPLTGSENPTNLPVIEVKPNQFKRASRAIWDEDFLGSSRDETPELSRVASLDQQLKASKYIPDPLHNPADPNNKRKPSMVDSTRAPVVDQAMIFSKILFNPKYEHLFTGKPMTVKQIAHELLKAAPAKTDADVNYRKKLGDIGADAIEKKFIDEDDMEMATGAVMHMIQIAHKGGYNFFQVKGGSPASLTPDSVVVFVPPSQLRNSDADLHGTVAATPAAGQEQDVRKLAARLKAGITRRHKPAPPAGPAPAAECAAWMDVYELMEHWQF